MMDYMEDNTNFVKIDLKFQGNFRESDLCIIVPRWMIKRNRGTANAIMIKMVNDLNSWTQVIPTRFYKFLKDPIGELEFLQSPSLVQSLAESPCQNAQLQKRQNQL